MIPWAVILVAFFIGYWCGLSRARRVLGAYLRGGYEGDHLWTDWSFPYAASNGEMWQQRSCQCGNRDFRRLP